MLCLEEKPLIKKSHIIPQFMYKRILEDDGYFYKVNEESLKNYKDGKRVREFIIGEYDSDILCNKCENEILSKRYEDYAAKVYQLVFGEIKTFSDIKMKEYRNINGFNGIELNNVDYTRFKLFLLSILWRSSISKRGFFNYVSLGSEHEEAIRLMLLDNNPKDVVDYPCFICDLSNDAPFLKGTIGIPIKIKDKSNTSYCFIIAGIMYMFSVSKYRRKAIAQEGVINPENKMIIWDSPEGFGMFNAAIIRRDFHKLVR